MNIIKPRLKWKEPLVSNDTANINVIALHHIAATTATAYDIHEWHLSRGWKGAGYGWYIRKDGTVFEMRGFNVNAGVENENDHILSIAFEGNFDVESVMSDEQTEAGLELIEWLSTKLPNLKSIDGHYMWNTTSCPGKYFPLAEFRNGSKKKVEVVKVKDEKKENIPEWEWDSAKFLVSMGFFDSLHHPREPMTVAMAGKLAEEIVKWVQVYVDK